MKKLIMIMLSVIIATCALSACGSKGDWDYIEEKGTIIVGFDPHFPPMGFFEDESETESSKAVGFDVEVAKAMAELLDVTVEFKSIDWSQKAVELKSKNIDLIWNGYTITDERSEQHLFSTPYMKNDQVIVILKSNESTYTCLDDLIGQTVAVQKGSSAQEIIDGMSNIPKNTVLPFDDYADAIMALSNDVEYIVMDSVVAKYLANENNTLLVLSDVLGTEEYGIGMRAECTETQKIINEALETLKTNGKLAEIAAKWGLTDDLLIK